MVLTSLVLLLNIIPRFYTENIRYEKIFQDVHYKDTLPSVQPLKSTAATSAMSCVVDCMNENACESMSYNNEQELCFMYGSRITDTNNVINESGWQLYYTEQNVCTASDGYIYHAILGRCIKVYPGPKNYAESSQACLDIGSTLVKLDSNDMWQFVKDSVLPVGNVFYIQGSKQFDNIWKYDDNTAMTDFQWAPGQPDNSPPTYLTMKSGDGFLVHDASGNSQYGYVCEITLN